VRRRVPRARTRACRSPTRCFRRCGSASGPTSTARISARSPRACCPGTPGMTPTSPGPCFRRASKPAHPAPRSASVTRTCTSTAPHHTAQPSSVSPCAAAVWVVWVGFELGGTALSHRRACRYPTRGSASTAAGGGAADVHDPGRSERGCQSVGRVCLGADPSSDVRWHCHFRRIGSLVPTIDELKT
jgi:hypothetical protein